MELKLFFFSTETKAPLGASADNVENNSFKLLIAPGVVFHEVFWALLSNPKHLGVYVKRCDF
jgi:hypothetical protein